MKKYLVWMTMLMLLLGLVFAAQAETEGRIELRTEQLIIAVGKQAQARVSLTPSAYQKAGVTYEISDESIASVTKNGQVKGLSVGECTLKVISVKDPAVTAEIPVSVIRPVSKITAEAEKSTIRVGEKTQISCSYSPEDATMKSATFSSGNTKVAVVDENGVVTGVTRGTATITVRSADEAAKTTLRITVEQQPETIELSKEALSLVCGKNTQVKATVYPRNANNTGVTWTSSDESIATVDKYGRIVAHNPGQAVITAACQADESVTASLVVTTLRLAQSVEMDKAQYDIIIGETLQLFPTVLPEDATDKSVAYAVKNPKIASVDENGVVTALKGGKTTVTISTADGSKKKTTVTIHVIVPVQGVSFSKDSVRVGVNSYVTITADIYPADATSNAMIWTSSDDSIATIKGDTNKVRVYGHSWGRCTITGTTVDGSYSDSMIINVGSLRKAVVADSLSLSSNHHPYVRLRNRSNMHITSVSYTITGKDAKGNDLQLGKSKMASSSTLTVDLAPGESTRIRVGFGNSSAAKKLEYVEFAITGWETDTGYYDNNGNLQYSCHIGSGYLDWKSYASDHYKKEKLYTEK